MRIKAHPTKYNGTLFRSRLEATWAAMFDICAIGWSYEPVDLDGWTPDFEITLRGIQVLVEVKPVSLVKLPDMNARILPSDQSFEKARKHYGDAWILMLGREPNDDADYFGFGWLMDPPFGSKTSWWTVQSAMCITKSDSMWKDAKNRTQWVPA